MKPSSAFASAVLLLPAAGWAIDAEDTTRPTPPPPPTYRDRPVERETDTRGAVEASEDQELLPGLVGFAIAPDARSAVDLQQRTRTGVAIEGFSELDAAWLRRLVEPAIGKPVSLRSLNRLVADIELELRARGLLLQRVSYPAQEITSGVVALRLGPAVAGEVRISGKAAFGRKFAAEGFRTRPGDELREAVVLDDLDWLNENPLRRASISRRDGTAGDDILDVTLRMNSPKAWRVYGGVDNQLSEDLGDERLFLGFQHGNVFGLDHRFTGQYTAALDFDRLQGVSLMHEIPLPVRHLLDFSAGYTESEANTIGPLDQSGEFFRAALGYRVPLPRWQGMGHEWRAGLEFRNNDYLFPDGSDSQVCFFQIVTGWKAKRADRWGSGRVDVELSYNPGQGILGSEDDDYIALGASGAESLIARITAERSLKLGDAGSLVGRIHGQLADSNLLSSDELAAAGATRVRGFDENVGYASNGLVATLEYQTPVFPVPHAGDLMGLVFLDGATLDRESVFRTGQLFSTGIGVRWRFNDHLAGRADLGIPLDQPEWVDDDPLLHFGVSLNW